MGNICTSGREKTGSLYLKGKAEVRVALQSVDGEKEYAVQCIRANAGDWKKYTFELTPDKPMKMHALLFIWKRKDAFR